MLERCVQDPRVDYHRTVLGNECRLKMQSRYRLLEMLVGKKRLGLQERKKP